MRKLLIYILMICSGFIIGIQADASVEIIDDFSVTIDMMRDSSILVTEEISYDFGVGKKHGIYRDIPFKYKARGGTFSLRLSKISVSNELGEAYNFSVNKKGIYQNIKIGDADALVSGKKKYIIKYKIDRAINFFENYDELYWNVTGDKWTVPIKQSKVVVNFPRALNEEKIKAQCFSGKPGSSSQCISYRYEYKSKDMVKSVNFVDDKLQVTEGFTFVLGIPKNIIKEPHIVVKIFQAVKDNFILGLPLVTFFILLLNWYKRGKDPMGRGVVISQFDSPKNLTPSEVGTIIDERVHRRDISADIIGLAVKGYLKIAKIKKDGLLLKSNDYLLSKLKPSDDFLAKHEKMLFNSLFKGDNESEFKLSQLKEKFYKDLEKVKKEIYASLVKKEIFVKNPTKVRGFYTVVGVVLLVLGWFSGPLFDFFGVLGFALSGILVIIFGVFMPKKTKKGVLAREHILGLKEYIKVAEKDRINFHSAPSRSPERFERLLPFAMALRVEKEWAKQFEGIYNENPSWYHDSSTSHFSAMGLSHGLRNFSSKANATLSSSPSSASNGGSGFSGGSSGGGFGGGGGGSW